MLFFSARADLKFMHLLLNRFEELRRFEDKTYKELDAEGATYLSSYGMLKHVREQAIERYPDYSELRKKYTRMITRATRICEEHSVKFFMKGRAAGLEGGTPFEGSVYELVLNCPSTLTDIDNEVRDTTNKVIGSLEHKVQKEGMQIINPFFWIKEIAVWIVRLPYTLIKISGFDVDKVQEHFMGKVAHLIYVILLILFLLWIGAESLNDLKSIIGPVLIP